jgi:conjugal transfer pilus assembly protein TraW
MQKIFIVAALLAAVSSAQATDLGVQGKTWPIIEIDFRQLMLESASRADLSAAQNEVKASTEKFFDSFPQRYLPSIDKTTTRYIDPSITLGSDIMAPVPDDGGDYQWRVLAPKGARLNPLVKYRPLTAMLFFDGRDEAQLQFVRDVLKANPMRVVPVETAGANVKNLSKSFKRPIFYANDAMMARFNVEHLPSLLYPGSGDYSLYLGMTSFAAPYKQAELESVWPVNAPVSVQGLSSEAVSDADKKAVGTLLNINPKKETPNAKSN